MKEISNALIKALQQLRDVSGDIQIILANASAMGYDEDDVIDSIRNEAFEIVDACDATEDGFDYLDDDFYFDKEDD